MAWKRSGVQFPLAPLRNVSELVFLDIARETEMPTDPGHGNSAEIHFLPTTSEFLFNSATTATGAAHGGNEGLIATFIRWCDLVRERSPRTLESYYYVLGHLVRWLGPRSVTGVSRRDLELFVLRPRLDRVLRHDRNLLHPHPARSCRRQVPAHSHTWRRSGALHAGNGASRRNHGQRATAPNRRPLRRESQRSRPFAGPQSLTSGMCRVTATVSATTD